MEIREECGPENIFIFGMTVAEVQALQQSGYSPQRVYESNPKLKEVIDQVGLGLCVRARVPVCASAHECASVCLRACASVCCKHVYMHSCAACSITV